MGRMWKTGLAGAAALLGTVLIAAPAGASPPSAFHGTITFDGSDNPGVADFTGSISGTGVDITTIDRTSGKSTVSHDRDDLVLGDGTIHVKDVGKSSDTFDQATCTDTTTEKGTFTLQGGDGAYSGIKGHGHFTVAGTITFAPDGNGGCDFQSGPTSGSIVVTIDGVAKV